MAYLQVANSRGGEALILEDFRYLKNKSIAGKIYWRCANRGCNVYLHTNVFDPDEEDPQIQITQQPGAHGHMPDSDLVATTALIEQMLQLVEADPTCPIKRINDQVIIDYQICSAFLTAQSQFK